MNFQVKGQEYFLAFVEEERKWFVFVPGTQEVQRIPVYVDAPKTERPSAFEIGKDGSPRQ